MSKPEEWDGMKKIILAAALAACATTATAGGSWSNTKVSNQGQYYTAAQASSHESAYIALYAYPNADCDISARLINRLSATAEARSGEANIQLRVDRRQIWSLENADYEISDNDGDMLQSIAIGMDDELIGELAVGGVLKVRYETPNGWSQTVRFNLDGSSSSINSILRECAKDPGDWGASSDNHEWDS